MINKQDILSRIIEALRQDVESLAHAAKIAHADATNPESKAENKYDTRGLEASYLAGAQARRTAELMKSLAFYNTLETKPFTREDAIALTALIELEAEDGAQSYYFLGAMGGGTEVEYNGYKILLITPSSPLGGKLLGREIGDCVTMQNKEYEITALW